MSKKTYNSEDIRLARYLKALSHPARLEIIRTLMNRCSCPHGCNPCCCGEKCEGETCKCGCKCGTLVGEVKMSQSTVSQHIKELKSAGLIDLSCRKGDYTLNHVAMNEIMTLLGARMSLLPSLNS